MYCDAHRVVGAVQFGFELGTGVRTYLTSTSPYVLALFVATQIDQPLRAGLVGAMFGMGRGLMVLARRLSADPEAWDRRMDRSVGRLRITSSLLVLMTLAFMSFNPVWLDAI